MCGIIGYNKANTSSLSISLSTAIKQLNHRGPDDSGEWSDTYTGLGFVRLSIQDLSPAGHQPMLSPCGRYILIFNGEIYNFPDLRKTLEKKGEVFEGHSDTEILLRIFVRDGLEKCLQQLRGMFAFAIWDTKTETLSLARDRVGVKPLIYAETDDGFLFASEIAALFKLAPNLSRSADFQAIDHFLTFQYIPAPMTGFSAIRKLLPGHAMVVKKGKIESIFRYWDIDPSKKSKLSFTDASQALREKILEATKIRMVSDVPLGAFLSGGVDSSITVAAMAKLSEQPIQTFAIGFDDQKFNELPYAQQVAEHLGTEHHEMVVQANAVKYLPKLIEHIGEPLADSSILPTFYVSQFAKNNVTVALTGDGGDEAFNGYRRFYQMRRREMLEKTGMVPLWKGLRRATIAIEDMFHPKRSKRSFPTSRADEMLNLNGAEAYKHLLAFYPEHDKEALLTEKFKEARGDSKTTKYLENILKRTEGMDEGTKWPYLDLMSYLPEDILCKVDIASMAVSLECRSPFLDHEVIEFAYSLPGSYKLSSKGRHKYILKEAFKDWLPNDFMDRPKQGFSVPLNRWLREDFGDLLEKYLLQGKFLSDWFEQNQIEKYVKEHLSGEKSHSQHLWPLLVLAIWIKRFNVDMSFPS